jgi:hypothetical protein
MVKLMVEEGGVQRAFRLGDGLLTVGSGESARLALASPGIAAVHCELEIAGEEVRVRPMPGVLPPLLHGIQVTAEKALDPGERLHVGEAVLWFESESELEETAAAPVAKAPPRPVTRRSRRSRSRGGRGRRARAGKEARTVGAPSVAAADAAKPVVQRSRTSAQRGLPTWLPVSIGVTVLVLLVLFAKRAFDSQAAMGTSPVWASLATAREQLTAGNFDSADAWLDRAVKRGPSSDEQVEIAALRRQIGERRDAAVLAEINLTGTKYMDVMLKKYEAKWLAGTPSSAKVRFFLERLKEFRRRWPRHPDMDWVDRQEARFRGAVDLTAPPTWEELEWEVDYIVTQPVRDYAKAFELVDDFLGRASGMELTDARKLRDELVEGRRLYHEDKLNQARYEYERDDVSKSVWWLVNLIVFIGDDAMAEEAASYLIRIPDLELHVPGYENTYPERYRKLLAHPTVRAHARELGIIG